MLDRKLTSAGLVLLFAVAAAAEGGVISGPRAALLIGNAEYDGFTLPGVAESLDKVEQALQAESFLVQRHENLDEDAMEEAARAFVESVPTNGVALVYYVGLGAHTKRFDEYYNMLRPVDTKIENDGDYRGRTLRAKDLIEWLREDGGARLNLLFLDGCWDSPIKPDKDNLHNGFMRFEPEGNTTVVFAAASGESVPPPTEDAPTPLAEALAEHADQLDDSIASACQEITEDTAGATVGDAPQRGIGQRLPFPLAETLREGKTPGEGFVNSIGMTFRWCPAGSFTMGSADTDHPATRDRAPVQVTLSQGFWMGAYEVTQREYDLVRGRTPPPGFTHEKNAPFWGASESKHVTEFCEKLTEIERKAGTLPDGWAYACPTEAEWEYACRAGSTGRFCFGDEVEKLGEYGNFADKALHEANPNHHWAERRCDDGVGEALAPVGSYQPNAWGIHDMHGNVAELVADHLVAERPGGTDPFVQLEKNGVTQVRGGAWCSTPLYCESSFRNSMTGRDKFNFIGFRIVLKKVK